MTRLARFTTRFLAALFLLTVPADARADWLVVPPGLPVASAVPIAFVPMTCSALTLPFGVSLICTTSPAAAEGKRGAGTEKESDPVSTHDAIVAAVDEITLRLHLDEAGPLRAERHGQRPTPA